MQIIKLAVVVIFVQFSINEFICFHLCANFRTVASPSLRDNPKFIIQIAIFFFLAYVMIVSSIILTDV
jgi:hypothetical protein